MFLLVSVRHVAAHPDALQHGVSIQSSINLGKTFPRISRIRIIPSTQILARVFVYLPTFISQILDFICRMVLIFNVRLSEFNMIGQRKMCLLSAFRFGVQVGIRGNTKTFLWTKKKKPP